MIRQNSIIWLYGGMIGGSYVDEEMDRGSKIFTKFSSEIHRHSNLFSIITTSSVPDTALHMIFSK